MRVLITCPPMLGRLDDFKAFFEKKGVELVTPNVVQTLDEEELVRLVPLVDGWIIGDDPATDRIFKAGIGGRLKAAVKWGVGVDNVDFHAAARLDLPITNTPFMFGAEVADIAINYVIGLARQTFFIDREVRKGNWPKPAGISLRGKRAALIGYGDIGKATAVRLRAFGLEVVVHDPIAKPDDPQFRFLPFPEELGSADFVVITASLTPGSRRMINAESIAKMKKGVRIVNVSRGPIIDEQALVQGLESGQIHSAALDVFELEPLPADSPLRKFDSCIFGTHNGSNTVDAVQRASRQAIEYLFNFLDIPLHEEDWD